MIATCTMVLACLALHPGVDRGGGDDSQSFLGDGWDGPGLNATTVYCPMNAVPNSAVMVHGSEMMRVSG